MRDRLRLSCLVVTCAFALSSSPALPAGTGPARECLEQAAAVVAGVELAGDRSAARRELAISVARLDAQAALEIAGGIIRPSDAARALSAAAVALAPTDRAAALRIAMDASRLLLRIVEPARRQQEQRLLLAELGRLGEAALAATGELPADEARLALATGQAESDPGAALELLGGLQRTTGAADAPLARIADKLAAGDFDRAIRATAGIVSDGLRNQMLWRIGESLPPAEACELAMRVPDPLVRSGVVASAAARMAPDDIKAALAAAAEVEVARGSALAQLAVALAKTDEQEAVRVARSLEAGPRVWALGRIAVELAADRPERTAAILQEIPPSAEVARLALGRMAASDPARALQVARSLPAGLARDHALAAVVPATARLDPGQGSDLVWEIQDAEARGRAAEAVALELARADPDAATSLLGLVPEARRAMWLRAQVAVAAARRAPELAARLLAALPPSSYRCHAALEAGWALVTAGGSMEEALKLAAIGNDRDLSLRWILPRLSAGQALSTTLTAGTIADPYLRALALNDVARGLLKLEARCRPVPGRARLVRPIVEWEGI